MSDKLFNFALSTNFRFYCSELPIVSELAQDVTIPSITVGQALVSNRFKDYNQPGEKFNFMELDVGFVMDENYDAYAEIFSWMERMVGTPGQSPVRESERRVLTADAEVTILDNTGKAIRRITFLDAWPISIGALALDVQGQANEIKSIVTLDYSGIRIDPHAKNLSGLTGLQYSH